MCGMDGQTYGNACIANCTNTAIVVPPTPMGACAACFKPANRSKDNGTSSKWIQSCILALCQEQEQACIDGISSQVSGSIYCFN